MEAKKPRNILSGSQYDHLFPMPENGNKTIRKNATVDHTVDFIPKVVQETLDQTRGIAQRLKGRSVYETCSNIWHFVYRHINYRKDQQGYEQIRSPARSWHDRREGVDCDCYSVFISSILTNQGIPHILRITKYHRDYFQHIYPVVPHGGGHITIDCVTDKFNYEVPFSEKKDYPMDLQYLNGFDGDDGIGELGNILKKAVAKKAEKKKAKIAAKTAKPVMPAQKPVHPGIKPLMTSTTSPTAASPSAPAKKKPGILKKALNVVNKVNPATVLLRNGILAAMKLNIKNVAQRLRWSYLTAQQAAAKNIDPAKYQKLLQTRGKLENIFFGAGGKLDNLKNAILSGSGNKDKAVSALGMLPMAQWSGYLSEYTPLNHLLGPEIYHSENVDGMEGFQGFGELGEPVTLASVGAAMGVIAGIVASLKEIGNIFKGKQPGAEDFDEAKTDAAENNVQAPATSPVPLPFVSPSSAPLVRVAPPSGASEIAPTQNTKAYTEQENFIDDPIPTQNYPIVVAPRNSSLPIQTEMEEDTELPVVNNSPGSNPSSTTNTTNTTPPTEKESFWEKNKSWLKPVTIGAGGLTLIAIGFKLMKGTKSNSKSSPRSQGLSGVPKRKKKRKNHRSKTKSRHSPKKAVALL